MGDKTVKKPEREAIKALALAKLEEGLTYREVGRQLGISAATVYRMKKEDCKPEELESVKRALASIDLENLEKLSYTNKLVIQKILEKLEEGEADDLGLQVLARLAVDICKSYGIITDKVQMREGIALTGPQMPSVEAMTSALRAKIELARAESDRIRAEVALAESLKDQGTVIDVEPLS
jgi:DNA invertase Pin-like site-specific DNA recombinase